MRLTFILLLLFLPVVVFSWGFFAHKKINQHAVFSLPPEMMSFFKANIGYLSEKAVRPDQRRYSDPEEGSRHYIDADVYGDTAFEYLPRYWNDAVEKVGEDTLKKYGILPWHIFYLKKQLTSAFREKNEEYILYLAADLGHYIADAHVPLHTTINYDGQLTGQKGIHGLWESRLPELFFDDYDLWVGKAQYIEDVQGEIWNVIQESHHLVDSVLDMERKSSEQVRSDKKFAYEKRGSNLVRTYSETYSRTYHELMKGMVEDRLKHSVKLTADIWFTSWVDAGQPVLGESVLPFEETEFLENDPSHSH